mgnify:CR=1 FL=1
MKNNPSYLFNLKRSKEMKNEIKISKSFEGLQLKDGVYHYSGDLKIDGNASIYEHLIIDGDVVVAGNLTCHKDLKVLGSIFVYGDLTAAGNVSADKVIVNGDVSINENLDVELFCVLGNITVDGNMKTRRVSSCYGSLKTYNLVSDDRIYVDGNIDIKGKKYRPLIMGI